MTYLDDLAEQIRKYKVVTYTDHRPDDYVRYFDDFEPAFEYWKRMLTRTSSAEHTASAVLVDVSTGQPIHRQTWRV